MPKKTPAKRPRSSPVFVLVGSFHDVGNRQGNVRLIIEGPFKKSSGAAAVLIGMTRDGLYSLSETQVIPVRSAERFRASLDEIRALLEQ